MTNEDGILSGAIDPIILEIFLFKSNYKDRILISELKKRAQVVKVPGHETNSFFVNIEDMQDILYNRFMKDIQDFDSTPNRSLNKSVTSIFFIDSIMRGFSSLKYFKINVSDSPVYTRLSNDKIVFDYKVIHSKINLPQICSPEFLSDCKRILTYTGLYKSSIFDNKPYIEINARTLMSELRRYESEVDPEEDPDEIVKIKNFQMIFGNRVENDDSLLLIVIEM